MNDLKGKVAVVTGVSKGHRRGYRQGHKTKGSLIVPYIELFKNSKKSLPIISIIVGPHPFQDNQADAVRMAIESTPFSNTKVRLSTISAETI